MALRKTAFPELRPANSRQLSQESEFGVHLVEENAFLE